MTQAVLEASESETEVELVLKSQKVGLPPDETSILALLKESAEFKNYFILNENVKNALAELNEVLKPLQSGQKGKEIRYSIAQKRDALITITIEADKMSAFAEITAAYGGKTLTARDILSAAQNNGVVKGFNKEYLLLLAQKAAATPPGLTVKQQIAIGKLPIKGKDAKIRHMVESGQNRILRPKERDDGTVDMRDLGDIVCVKTGDLLAQRIPPTLGHKGFSVDGTILEPEPGEDLQLCAGDGVKVSENDANYLISEIVGMPKIIENGMMVDQVFQLNNVDVASGHVNFEGAVIIKGNVSEGMKVFASGDVTIGGFVESSYIEAGGDVTIRQGIIGRQFDTDTESASEHKMSVCINAQGNIFAKYAQYAEINSKSDVMIENQMMHCVLDVDKKVWVGKQDRANGKLIGGYIDAGEGVYAGTIGATAGTKTLIKYHKYLNEIKEQQQVINTKVNENKAKIDELTKTIEQIKKMPSSDKVKEILGKAVNTYQHYATILGDLMLEVELAEQRFVDCQNSATVNATEKLFHGVEVHIGDFFERSRREYGPSKFIYKERKVIIDPIVNN